MIPRILVKTIQSSLRPGFVTVVGGPRRVGKTVLLTQLAHEWKKEDPLIINGDTEEGRSVLGTTSIVKLTQLVGNRNLIFIDEAQRIPNIGLSLKIIIDAFPTKKIVVTGSVALPAMRGFRDTLVGRQQFFPLYPLSTRELTEGEEEYKKASFLDDQLVYGGYPYVWSLSTPAEKKDYLQTLVADYLFRDIAYLGIVGEPYLLQKLATLVAFQIGSEVSLNELSNHLGIDVKTVRRYLMFLEDSFVVFPLGVYSRNLRREVTGKRKWYFYDLGIRNALAGQFFPLGVRPDTGALWENFLVIERIKKNDYARRLVSRFFWRNYLGAEVDFIEKEGEEALYAYEFKWGKGVARTPKAFWDNYRTQAALVNKENYLDFV